MMTSNFKSLGENKISRPNSIGKWCTYNKYDYEGDRIVTIFSIVISMISFDRSWCIVLWLCLLCSSDELIPSNDEITRYGFLRCTDILGIQYVRTISNMSQQIFYEFYILYDFIG